MIPFSLYRKNGDAREPVQDPDLDLVFKLLPKRGPDALHAGAHSHV